MSEFLSDIESMPMLTPTEVLEHVWCPRFTWFMNVQHIPQHEESRYKVLKGREVHTQRENENKSYLRKKIGIVDKQIIVVEAIEGTNCGIIKLNNNSTVPIIYYVSLSSQKKWKTSFNR